MPSHKGLAKWFKQDWRDIGSRKGLTIAQSNIEYEGSSDTVKNVYTSKATTDIRKLVTEGYIKIPRATKDVEIVVEKENKKWPNFIQTYHQKIETSCRKQLTN